MECVGDEVRGEFRKLTDKYCTSRSVIAIFTTRLVLPSSPAPALNHRTVTGLHAPHLYAETMPHFPQPSQEVSETLTLPTRERESDHSESRRPQPSTTNDNNAQRTSRLRVQNRRRRYLELNPDYFSGSNLEQAGS